MAVVECWGEDVPAGELTSFPMAVKCKADEVVVFSWITWPDKETRERGGQQSMVDAEALGLTAPDSPFDPKRMIYGGFSAFVEA